MPKGISMSIFRRISQEEVTIAAQLIWSDKTIAKKVTLDALDTLNRTHKRNFVFFNGKSSKYIVGGLFYLLGYRYNALKKQRELADQLNTTDVTIRASYRQWLKEFPDLFVDVIGKLSENTNNSLHYYVLSNFDHRTIQPENTAH